MEVPFNVSEIAGVHDEEILLGMIACYAKFFENARKDSNLSKEDAMGQTLAVFGLLLSTLHIRIAHLEAQAPVKIPMQDGGYVQ